jgi:hypothetical protein
MRNSRINSYLINNNFSTFWVITKGIFGFLFLLKSPYFNAFDSFLKAGQR